MSLLELLRAWEVDGQTAQKIIDQEWTVQTLKFMTDDDVRELFSKVGPRRAFQAQLKGFLEKDALTTETLVVFADHLVSDTLMDTSEGNSTIDEGADSSSLASTSASSTPPRKRSRTATISHTNIIDELLDASLEGRLVLAEYRVNNKFDNSTRDSLVQCIIYYEFRNDYNTHLTSDRFNELALKIVELFPTEAKDTYFYSYKRTSKNKKKSKNVSAGRLVVRYHNLRRKLIHCNLIPKTTAAEEHLIDEEIDFTGIDFDNLEEDEDLRWLSSNTRPWKNVMEAWDRSFGNRSLITNNINSKNLVYAGKAIECVHDYFVVFPALAEKHGWELLCADFDRNFPGKDQCLAKLWPSVVDFALPRLLKAKKLNLKVEELTPDQLAVQILVQFSEIFKTRVLSQKTTWRLTKKEIQEGFVIHAQNDADWKSKSRNRIDHLKQLGYTPQPYLVFIGQLPDIQRFRFVIDSHYWDFESPVKAVDVAFKVLLATNSQYSAEARHIWTFLQQGVYSISNPLDYHNDKSLKGFLAQDLLDFKNFIKNKK